MPNLNVLKRLVWSHVRSVIASGAKQSLSLALIASLCLIALTAQSQNIVWTSQSQNSSQSMPCGGGDIGLNVWVEKGDVYLYLSRSGTFDENNTLLKLGRVKLSLSPNPFAGKTFKQELKLKEGYVQISGADKNISTAVKVWVDVFKPVVYLDIKNNKNINVTAEYQTWRNEDRLTKGKENNQNSYKWAPQGDVKTAKDNIDFKGNSIQFYHQNKTETVFDVTVNQQGLTNYKNELFNPLANLIFGGTMRGENMFPAGTNEGKYLSTNYKAWQLKSARPIKSTVISLAFNIEQGTLPNWEKNLSAVATNNYKQAEKQTLAWWNSFWSRSFIQINSTDTLANQIGRNYTLFRYMLGCNAKGKWPTKFNGGLFTFDPQFTDSTLNYTPDFRNWGGGTHTAQNQRLVYWPMLKSGDVEMMKPQFEFYLNILKNAELRSKIYWNHAGASFTEQIENFGLPNPAEYGWKRPDGYDKGMEYNAWLEYEWDTVLEFCLMILETERYEGKNIERYIPLIESSLTFFQEHYTYLAKQRGSKGVDANGHLVLYPGSGAETYKMAYNSTSTIAGLTTVLKGLIASPSLGENQRAKWQAMLKTIPSISFRQFDGHTTISPAKVWERINNTEIPQLYPVFPYGIYGVGKAGLDTARNTYKYDADALKFRSAKGWKQDNIWSARLGLTDEAVKLNTEKLKNSGRRFPAFWGPGFDWTPDHNWGGSGMIGLQEMLLQDDGKKILLFPTWPKNWDVHFKLHAQYQTTVEATLKDGKLIELKVVPASRKVDVVNMLEGK